MTAPVLVSKKEYCCGCAACKAVCSTNAITMKTDEYGFEYPAIDDDKCVGCKKCVKVCAYQNNTSLNKPQSAFAAVTNNTDVIESASGGVFASVATEFLKQGGTVIGCALENVKGRLIPHHISIDDLSDLKKLLGSKYVQSDTSEIYSTVKTLLNEDKNVLFSGIPCQVGALYSYLGKQYNNLFTVDLICHGVPSRKMFWDYLDYISKKRGNIREFVFRDKKRGLAFVMRAVFDKDGKKITKFIQHGESSYLTYFLRGDTYRNCCYKCPFASDMRQGDITIGDFWGIKKQHPELFDGSNKEFDPEKGISCILLNTEKGKEIIRSYGKKLSLHPSKFDKIAAENSQLIHPSIPLDCREKIMNIYKDGGFTALDKYFLKNAGMSVYVAKIKTKIPLSIKKFLKNKG